MRPAEERASRTGLVREVWAGQGWAQVHAWQPPELPQGACAPARRLWDRRPPCHLPDASCLCRTIVSCMAEVMWCSCDGLQRNHKARVRQPGGCGTQVLPIALLMRAACSGASSAAWLKSCTAPFVPSRATARRLRASQEAVEPLSSPAFVTFLMRAACAQSVSVM